MTVLALAYVPWIFGYMMLAFALMYVHPVVVTLAAWGWLAAYGAICFAWLRGRTRGALVQSLLVPVPVMVFLFIWDLKASGELGRAAQWLLLVPAHGIGAGVALLWLQRHFGAVK